MDLGSLLNSALGFGDTSRRLANFAVGHRAMQAIVPGDSVLFSIKDILFNREYEFFPSFELKRLTGIVIDAGAHAGLYTLVSSLSATVVIALEPDADNFSILKANVNRNGRSNVVLINSALWARNEPVRFYKRGNSQLGALAKRKSIVPIVVNALSLESLVEKATQVGTKRVDLLKLDIEGAEFEVVSGSSERAFDRIDRLVAEIHTEHGDVRALTTKLARLGFGYVVMRRPIRKVANRDVHIVGHYKMRLLLEATNLVSNLSLYSDWSSLILFASRNREDITPQMLADVKNKVIDSS